MTILTQCANCIHSNRDRTCKAFPNGIPKEIRKNEHDHRTPYPSDNGIQFKPRDKELGYAT